LGKNAWALVFGNGGASSHTRGERSLINCYRIANTSPKVVNKLGLSFSSTKELNNIIDNALPGCPAFECRELVIGGETLDFYHRDILACIRSIYGDPELAQDLIVAPERHYADQGHADRIYSEMHTGDWWWAVQVRNIYSRPGIVPTNP
jgi:hypothetical protein